MMKSSRRFPNVLVRRLGLDRNPMRRRSDRIQSWVGVVALLLLVVACASAVAVGRATYEPRLAAERADARLGYRATGHVLSKASAVVSPDGYPVRSAVRIAWEDRRGRRHVDVFVTRTGMGTVPLWIGSDGRASVKPPLGAGVVRASVFAGLYWFVVMAAGTAMAYLAVVILLDRRRLAGWEREWASVEPGWRRQTL